MDTASAATFRLRAIATHSASLNCMLRRLRAGDQREASLLEHVGSFRTLEEIEKLPGGRILGGGNRRNRIDDRLMAVLAESVDDPDALVRPGIGFIDDAE